MPDPGRSTENTGAPSDTLREIYERRAALDYAIPVSLPNPSVDRKFEQVMALVAANLPADSLLDAGCGDGRFLAAIGRLPNSPERLIGVDISQRILETAAATVESHRVCAVFERSNIERLPFADDSFERVLCVQVIEHLLDPAAGVSELARVLRSGGRLILTTDNSKNHVSRGLNAPRRLLVNSLGLTGKRRKVSFPHASFSPSAVIEIVETVGLSTETIRTFSFHLDGVDRPTVKRLLNKLDRALPLHQMGDIVAVVATKRRL